MMLRMEDCLGCVIWTQSADAVVGGGDAPGVGC